MTTLQQRRNERQEAKIPENAELVDSYTFTQPADNAKLGVALYEGRASFGRRSDYQPIPCRWLLLRQHDSGTVTVRQYSGKRYDLAQRHIDEAKTMYDYQRAGDPNA